MNRRPLCGPPIDRRSCRLGSVPSGVSHGGSRSRRHPSPHLDPDRLARGPDHRPRDRGHGAGSRRAGALGAALRRRGQRCRARVDRALQRRRTERRPLRLEPGLGWQRLQLRNAPARGRDRIRRLLRARRAGERSGQRRALLRLGAGPDARPPEQRRDRRRGGALRAPRASDHGGDRSRLRGDLRRGERQRTARRERLAGLGGRGRRAGRCQPRAPRRLRRRTRLAAPDRAESGRRSAHGSRAARHRVRRHRTRRPGVARTPAAAPIGHRSAPPI